MNTQKRILAGLGLFFLACAGQAAEVLVTHYETLRGLESKAHDAGAPAELSFDAMGRRFDFKLQPNLRFLSADARAALSERVHVYRGQLDGNSQSWVRVVMFDGEPTGMFWDGADLYAIEAPGNSAVQSDAPVIYRLRDTFVSAGSMTCGSHSLAGNGAALYKAVISGIQPVIAQDVGAVSEIDIGAVGDFEFTSAKGGDAAAQAAIITRLNMVDGIYSNDIGVQINIPLVETFSAAADPFSDETNPSLLIDEVATYRDNTPAQNVLGLTHLYTGRDLDGTTVGIAFDNVLCRTRVGAGLSEGNGSATFDSLIAAHEIGHNFGAPHDGVAGACLAEPMTFIMAPSLNGSTQFSQCSIGIMQANAAAASCVTALPTVDMSVALSGQPATVFLTNSPQLTIDLTNNGASMATNVVADITLPANVTFVSAASTAGNCTDGAGTVNCQLGNVSGLTSQTVTLTTNATAVGSGMFDVTVSTDDADERPANDQQSVQLTVDPAVNLVATNPPNLSINLDQSTSVSTTIENRSTLDATGVTLSISFSNGLRPDTASWSIGTCTVAAQQVDCQAATVANLSASTLTIGVTGETAGTRSYVGTLLSNEADADTADNDVTASVSIVDPASESGGGSVQVPFLLLLGFLALLSRAPTAR